MRGSIETIRPIVVISKCLEFEACRYNGQMITFDFVRTLREYVTFVPICPEVEIGLGTPRDPIVIVGQDGEPRLRQPFTGRDITDEMRAFSAQFLGSPNEVDGFILKSRSPTCGLKGVRVYNETGLEPTKVTSRGLFAGSILDQFRGLAIEDEQHLEDVQVRDQWLTKLFLHARFRQAQRDAESSSLEQFHDDNKMLLMSYDHECSRMLGDIAKQRVIMAESGRWGRYREVMMEAVQRQSRPSVQRNALAWAMGRFHDQLDSNERKSFLESIDKYGEGKIPRQELVNRLQNWAFKYHNELVRRQTYFSPYPVALSDSPDERVQ